MWQDSSLSGQHGTVKEAKRSQLEKDIVWEINKFRADPVKWCNANGLSPLDGIAAQQEFLGTGPRRGNYNFSAQPLYPSQGTAQSRAAPDFVRQYGA
jgi:hypothetical protein